MLLRLDFENLPFGIWVIIFLIPIFVILEGFFSGGIAMLGGYLFGESISKKESPFWFYINVAGYLLCDLFLFYAYKNRKKMSWKKKEK